MNSSTNNGTTSRLLVGVFNDKANAEKAYDDLKEMGYSADEINVVMTSDTQKRHYASDNKDSRSEMGNKAKEGTGTGATIGGVIGGIGGALAAVGTNLLIPGLGLIVLGPLAAGLAGAGAGGIAGGIIGALVGAGIPEEKAKSYHEALENGSILITVEVRGREDAEKLARKWAEYHAEVSY